jgi:hypothetical protein
MRTGQTIDRIRYRRIYRSQRPDLDIILNLSGTILVNIALARDRSLLGVTCLEKGQFRNAAQESIACFMLSFLL